MTSRLDTDPPPPTGADEPAGLRLVEVEGASCRGGGPDGRHVNGNEIVHGGLIATVVATGRAVYAIADRVRAG